MPNGVWVWGEKQLATLLDNMIRITFTLPKIPMQEPTDYDPDGQ